MLGPGMGKPDAPAGNRGGDEVRAALDAIRHDLVGRAREAIHSLYMDRVGACAFDLRAHCRQECCELDDLRLARGILDDGLAGGAGRGHQQILSTRHGHRVEHEPCTVELLRTRADIPIVDRDRRTHRAQAHDVQIHGPSADSAAARQRHIGMAISTEQRAQDQDRRAHRLDELVRREKLLDTRRISDDAAFGAMLGRDAHALQQLQRRRDVVQLGHVADRHRAFGEQRGGQNRQRRVFRAGDSNFSVEPPAPNDR
jgi:hypothetical protein